MMYCRVRSLRWRRPSIAAGWEGPAIVRSVTRRRSGRKQAIDDPDPQGTGLLERQAVKLAHATPAFEVNQRFERDQGAPAIDFGERSQFRLIHQLQALHDQLARQPEAGLEFDRIALVGIQRAPQRQPPLAGVRPGLDLGTQASLAIA